MSRMPVWITLFALLAVGLAALPAAGAQTIDGVATAKESGCPDDKFYCWEIQLDDEPTPGARIDLAVMNPEENRERHNLYVKFDAVHEDGRDTEGSTADATSEDLSPGDTTVMTFTIPEDASSVYYWCDIPIHETANDMWGQWVFDEAPDPGDGDAGDGDGAGDGGGQAEEPNGSPGPGLLAALAGLGLSAAVLGRQRA